jgi:hypothetical protein
MGSAGAIALTALVGAAPAHATFICTEPFNTYDFKSGLFYRPSGGVAHIQYNVTCTGVANVGSTNVTQHTGSSGFDYYYSGDCNIATMGNDFFAGFVLGGKVVVEVGTTRLPYGYAKTGELHWAEIGPVGTEPQCAGYGASAQEVSVEY